MLWPGNWDGNNLQMCSFALTNLLLLASPLLLRRALKGGKLSWLVPALLTIATLDVFSLLRGEGLIGFYIWVASYGLVTAGSLALLKAQRMKPAPTDTPTVPRPRTPEELAAERELEAYLRPV